MFATVTLWQAGWLTYPAHIQVDTPTRDVMRGRFPKRLVTYLVAPDGTFSKQLPLWCAWVDPFHHLLGTLVFQWGALSSSSPGSTCQWQWCTKDPGSPPEHGSTESRYDRSLEDGTKPVGIKMTPWNPSDNTTLSRWTSPRDSKEEINWTHVSADPESGSLQSRWPWGCRGPGLTWPC